jgi:hypothetical protein
MNPTHAVPSLAGLSASQKRALVLRDHLHYVAPHHLDSFLTLGTPEPPAYRVVDGAVHPPLTDVGIRPGALRFELGNVSFPGKRTQVLRAALVYVGARVEMQTEEGDGGDVPIHVFFAEKMAGLFWEKIERVKGRCAEVNRARREAWERAKQTGQTQAKQEASHVQVRSTPAASTITTMEGLTTQTSRHVEACSTRPHKRPRPSTPVDALLTASQTLIAVYTNPDSEFADLHSAVVGLKRAVDAATSTDVTAEDQPSGGVPAPGTTADKCEATGRFRETAAVDDRRSRSADMTTRLQTAVLEHERERELEHDHDQGSPLRRGASGRMLSQPHDHAYAEQSQGQGQGQGQGQSQGQGVVPALTSEAGCVAPVARMIPAGDAE